MEVNYPWLKESILVNKSGYACSVCHDILSMFHMEVRIHSTKSAVKVMPLLPILMSRGTKIKEISDVLYRTLSYFQF